MRKEQMFDWDRRYYKECWENVKKVQKLLRKFPELKNFTLSSSYGNLSIKGSSLKDLHEVRTFLKERIKWEDKISEKIAFRTYLQIAYKGSKPYDFIIITIDFPYNDLPEGILGDCHIETEEKEMKAYTFTSKSVVCPLGV